jgi:SAM-dependent methyltransferase
MMPWQADDLDYWNHNSAYHPMIVSVAERVHGDVLDVGCGEGLLVERLSKVSRYVTGVDRDDSAVRQAAARAAPLPNVRVVEADFLTMDIAPDSFDLVIFVAVIHHMDLVRALRRSHQLLRPGGKLLVIGLSANKSVGDYGTFCCAPSRCPPPEQDSSRGPLGPGGSDTTGGELLGDQRHGRPRAPGGPYASCLVLPIRPGVEQVSW